MTELQSLGVSAKKAAAFLNTADTDYKNKILNCIADFLCNKASEIVEANKIDIANSEKNGVSKAMQDRLLFTEERIMASAEGVRKVCDISDPVGEVLETLKRPNGLIIEKRRVPLGVVGIIYEARPNVTVDTAVLCIKASNAVILRGGKEAVNTNTAIVKVMKEALKEVGADENIIGFVTDTSRDSANEMMRLKEYIDVLIPRGGAGLINAVVQNATVPVIETGVGNCHTYVDKSADIKMAVDIISNAKMSRPSVCNACESLLVHKAVPDEFYVELDKKFKEKNVKVYASKDFMDRLTVVREATDEDFATEFLDYAISVKTVNSVSEAIEHISKYSTKHSECIITGDKESAELFTSCIDAAAVYVNASTRFTDGFEFGFGAEIGISTQKLHARGPMGLKELTSYKYVVSGTGQIR